MQIQPLRGSRNLYPEDMRIRNTFIRLCKDVLERSGYEEYEAPLLEPMALFEARSSAEIVERQAYAFTDRGGERVVVRPELTPSLARMVANKQGELPPLMRWFSFADCWRYERPQKGRSRNFLQLNVDFLGSDSREADVEIIDLALTLLQALGMNMQNITLRVNDRSSFEQICDSLCIDRAQRGKFLTLLDERGKLEEAEFLLRLREIHQNLTLADLSRIDDMKPSDRLQGIIQTVADAGWTQLVYDPALIRGFSYYTGMVFEVFDTSGTYGRAIFGGGRYDNLLESVGGKPMSAVGFAVSDVSTFAAMEAQGSSMDIPVVEKTLVIPFSSEEYVVAQNVARKLRKIGRVTLLAVPPYELKKQLAMANRLNMDTAIIVAPDELAQGNVIEKNMKTGEQRMIALPA